MTTQPKFFLKCPRCPEKLFQRNTDNFTRYETERCSNCGILCEVDWCNTDKKPFAQQKALITID